MIRFTQKLALVLIGSFVAISCNALPEDPRTWESLYPQKSMRSNDKPLGVTAGTLKRNTQTGTVRNIRSPNHGFFKPDNLKGSNPLFRSGLMLTGAGTTLKGQKLENEEDGILTAYEARNLNLDNTDLVVLSPCETGLGEIKNGEGKYGLQRAFKVAGAKSIIMSLWKVDDGATQELMAGFYKHWLKLAGSTKRQAFYKAQKGLKAKYPDPYYWGAFVMVGE